MRIQTLTLLSHLFCGALAASAVVLAGKADAGLPGQLACLGGAVMLVAAIAWLVGAKFNQGLQRLIQATGKPDRVKDLVTGIREFDGTARQLSQYVQRWSDAAVAARQQTQDVDQLVAQLDRRSPRKNAPTGSAGEQLRHLLEGISQTIDAQSRQVLSGVEDIWHALGEVAEGADNQHGALSKTATQIEQLRANIQAATQNAHRLQDAVALIRTLAQDATTDTGGLSHAVAGLREQFTVQQRSFRTMSDHSREIEALIETIRGLAARTDMLALNASIESVRAGEHGKGFAVVADEVHRFSEQTAQAAREAATMLDAARLETRESIQDIAAAQQQIERELQAVESLQAKLQRVIHVAQESSDKLDEIPSDAEHQLATIEDVLHAVQRISSVAKSTRQQAEKARWTTKALTKLISQLYTALAPLRGRSAQATGVLPESLAQGLADIPCGETAWDELNGGSVAEHLEVANVGQ